MSSDERHVRWFEEISSDDVPRVGGKNASLGEMISALKEEGVRVPGGFATTADAYRMFLEENGIRDRIAGEIDAMRDGRQSLEDTGSKIRRLIGGSSIPQGTAEAIRKAYRELSERNDVDEADVAVRSSATAEDLPDASFAGQQETYLNVTGGEDLLEACRKCFASLFTDRAISYREEQGFDHLKIALSVGVQKMVRSDTAGSGVMFTLDPESGFPGVIVINAAWGLGENVVQGTVTPDEYMVAKERLGIDGVVPIVEKTLGDKEKKMIYARGAGQTTKNVDTPKNERNSFVLEDGETIRLAQWAVAIEKHYERPMDIEWAKDGPTGDLFIVQARPETVQSQRAQGSLKTYSLREKGERVLEGLAIGEAVAAARALLIKSSDEIDRFEEGSILVTGMTDPDWVPIMKKAAGIITDYGGRTAHAAIVSRELGIPAVIGTGDATHVLDDGQEITISCAEGDTGYVYDGILEYEAEDLDLEGIPDTETEIMMNIASPAAAMRWWRLPVSGIGLARMEFIINNGISIHPMALVRFEDLEDDEAKKEIERLTAGYDDRKEYFVDVLSRGMARIASVWYPDPVIVRMSDFKTNEYADLLGGSQFEPEEANPMLGFRGASRYYSDEYRAGFELECGAVRRAREKLGMDNIVVMIPFCRTIEEADRVLEILEDQGVRGGKNGAEVYVMCEVPSNVILAEEFAGRFDGFSIGSNDLTQLVLGVDRDSAQLSNLFDERDEAVRKTIADLISRAHEKDTKVGICGQAPSDYPEFAAFLVRSGIDSISLNPDSVVEVIGRVAEAEKSRKGKGE